MGKSTDRGEEDWRELSWVVVVVVLESLVFCRSSKSRCETRETRNEVELNN